MSKHATTTSAQRGWWNFGVPFDMTQKDLICMPRNGVFQEKKTLGA
jgi:hypothetical protein